MRSSAWPHSFCYVEKAVLWSAVAQWLKPLQRGGADADHMGLAAHAEEVNFASDSQRLGDHPLQAISSFYGDATG